MQKQLPTPTIPNVHYRKGDVMASVNKFIADTDAKIIINKHTAKATMATGHQELFMSQALYEFFRHGFIPSKPTMTFNPLKTYMEDRIVDEHRSFDAMFIYCDVV